LHLLGRFDEAEADFSRAIALQPQSRYHHARAASRGRLGRHAEAAADLQAALTSTPAASEEAFCSNNLAWIYVAGPTEVRAPDRALPLASRAVRLAPENTNYLNTLGVTYYRLERFDEAVATLRRSLRGSSAAAYDLYFLALCHKRLGDGARAQDYHDQAEYWMKLNADTLDPRTRAELETFRQEAKALGLP
jgi:tetratricopeptide (TPR) repeat protein